MLDRVQGGSTIPAGTGPVFTPPPPPPPEPAPKVEENKKPEGDKSAVDGNKGQKSNAKLPDGKKKDDYNPFDSNDSTPRQVADGTSTAADVAETAKDARGIAGLATSVGSRFSRLSRLASGVSRGLTWVADKGAAIGRAAPTVARGFAGLAKAAPFIGVGMAALDIGKAIAEKDPAKKQIAIGTAAMSTFSSAASIGGTALLATPLAPVGVGLIAAGIGVSVLSFVDTTFFGGKVSSVVGAGVKAVGSAAKAVGSAVADAGKAVGNAVADAGKAVGNVASKAWGAISSL